ncbi:hypothetical protein Q9L58_006868 [Maublancomyces gigas]|uniref:Uncharacterized protein n=1 Tax=Discina gigas TaxID=1032678 RepID=A0ABR3GDZ5_9PEZI
MDPTHAYPDGKIRTPTVKLKAPPYTNTSEKKDLKPPHTADIIDHVFQPDACRATDQASLDYKRPITDTILEMGLDIWMTLSKAAMEKCEQAKSAGEKTFVHVFGKHGDTIEVFFDYNIDEKRLPTSYQTEPWMRWKNWAIR